MLSYGLRTVSFALLVADNVRLHRLWAWSDVSAFLASPVSQLNFTFVLEPMQCSGNKFSHVNVVVTKGLRFHQHLRPFSRCCKLIRNHHFYCNDEEWVLTGSPLILAPSSCAWKGGLSRNNGEQQGCQLSRMSVRDNSTGAPEFSGTSGTHVFLLIKCRLRAKTK